MNISHIRYGIRNKGRGVFADKAIRNGTYVIIDPAVILPGKQSQLIDKTALAQYYFDWEGTAFVALGQSSLLNHSDKPNLDWAFNKKDQTVGFFAARDIKKDEELTFDYGWETYPWKKKLRSKKKKVK